MNQNHLEVLTQNYIENFQMINNDDHAEYYKWEAVQQFQKEWDPDAPDFAAMFKRAVSKTENLINNHITQPNIFQNFPIIISYHRHYHHYHHHPYHPYYFLFPLFPLFL